MKVQIALLLVGFATTPALAWNLTPCSPDHQQSWSESAKELREAEPGSPGYVPHPFPRNHHEVVEDFLWYHTKAFDDTPLQKRSLEEQRFFDALERGRLRFEVQRVANWTPLRCGPKRERPFFFLIQVFEQGDELEITRVVVDADGRPFSLIHRPTANSLKMYPRPLPDLGDAETLAQAVTGSTGLRRAQYVAASGTLHCSPLHPCVAVRDPASAYMVRAEEIVRLELANGELSLSAELVPGNRPAVLEELRSQGRHLVSLGGDVFVTATPLLQDD